MTLEEFELFMNKAEDNLAETLDTGKLYYKQQGLCICLMLARESMPNSVGRSFNDPLWASIQSEFERQTTPNVPEGERLPTYWLGNQTSENLPFRHTMLLMFEETCLSFELYKRWKS